MDNDRHASALRLGRLIDQNRTEIERRWLARVQKDICRTPGIELTHLRDGLPDYLVALVGLLSRQGGEVNEQRQSEPAWAKVAREHGITRVRIGFDINQLVHEFVVLRHIIREVTQDEGEAMNPRETILTDCLDAAIAAAVSAYVEARDYEARRRQAQNIGFLTHELRNPLSTATVATSQLRRHATSQQERALAMLDRSHKRLSELVDSVLVAQRLEAGKIEPHPSDVRLESVLEPALEDARRTALAKGLAFRTHYDPELRVRVDPLLTRSAIQNLADNAAKYADHGFVEVTVDDEPDELVVHVRDSCEGISPEDLRTIFEPFERGTTGKSGTGLGLAIAKQVVVAQGGSIHAESYEEGGCHFWITLPKRTSTPEEPA